MAFARRGPATVAPSYMERRENELRERHHVYHGKLNPDEFARLRAENFKNNPED